jgi:hypothetical protein
MLSKGSLRSLSAQSQTWLSMMLCNVCSLPLLPNLCLKLTLALAQTASPRGPNTALQFPGKAWMAVMGNFSSATLTNVAGTVWVFLKQLPCSWWEPAGHEGTWCLNTGHLCPDCWWLLVVEMQTQPWQPLRYLHHHGSKPIPSAETTSGELKVLAHCFRFMFLFFLFLRQTFKYYNIFNQLHI